MRRADLWTAGALVAFSVWLMWMSTDLPIGWDPETGPGGGAFPFWSAAVLCASSLLVLARSWLRVTPHGRSTERFVAHGAVRIVTVVGLALVGLVGGVHLVGVYVAVPLFLVFYLRGLGGHSWRLTLTIAIVTPVVVFVFFEKLMLILLPKGYTESLFYIFY